MVPSSTRVVVIGGGVIGLSIAHELAPHVDVQVVEDRPVERTVSAVSAALWFPFETERSDEADGMLRASYRRFAALTVDGAAPVGMRRGTVIERDPTASRDWTSLADGVEELGEADLPVGATAGISATLPMIEMPAYLPWLRAGAAARGASFRQQEVTSLEQLVGRADVVVVAAGLGSAALLGGDAALHPVRGQVVRVANPGLERWITDAQDPRGLTYVFPRSADVVVGGTHEVGSWDEGVDEQAARAMLDRATELVPALRGQPLLGAAAGLRPARARMRVERVPDAPLPTIAAYGHGGAGVTLSWGTAERVAELVRALA